MYLCLPDGSTPPRGPMAGARFNNWPISMAFLPLELYAGAEAMSNNDRAA